MTETFLPPVAQHIFPFARTINDVRVVVLPEGDGTFYPEPCPANVEQMTCNADGAVEKDEQA